MKHLKIVILLLVISYYSYSQSYINYVLGKYVGTVVRSGCPSPVTSNGSLTLVPSTNYSVTVYEEDSSAVGFWTEPWDIFVNSDSTMLRYPGMDSTAYGQLYANDSIHLFVKIFGSPFCNRVFDGFKLYSTVGLDKLYLPGNELVISPQPASNEVYMQSVQLLFRKEEEMLIYDVNGKKIKVPVLYINSNTYKVDVSGLETGMYTAFVSTDKGILRKKVVIAK